MAKTVSVVVTDDLDGLVAIEIQSISAVTAPYLPTSAGSAGMAPAPRCALDGARAGEGAGFLRQVTNTVALQTRRGVTSALPGTSLWEPAPTAP